MGWKELMKWWIEALNVNFQERILKLSTMGYPKDKNGNDIVPEDIFK